MNVHFSSATEEWYTPVEFFRSLDTEFTFTLDPCATKDNAKCKFFYSKEENGLAQDWSGHCVFMNPPYGRSILLWMKKAYESSLDGKTTVVCLVPARTDTKWFHEYALRGEIRFIKGRIKFGGAKHNAPFPSMLVIFKGART